MLRRATPEDAGSGNGTWRTLWLFMAEEVASWRRLEETEIAGPPPAGRTYLRLPIRRPWTRHGGRLAPPTSLASRLQVEARPSGPKGDPGPAWLRPRGPLTITDANLFAKGRRLQAAAFPGVFGPGGDQGPDSGAGEPAVSRAGERVALATGRAEHRLKPWPKEPWRFANDREWPKRIRRISDSSAAMTPRCTLVATAAPGPARRALAERLGNPSAAAPSPGRSALAYGIGLADQRLLARGGGCVKPLDAALVGTAAGKRRRAWLKRIPPPGPSFMLGCGSPAQ